VGIFLFPTVPETALEPTQPPIQWVSVALSLGESGWAVKLTTHFHLVVRSRMRGAIPPIRLYVFMAWCSVKHRDCSSNKSTNLGGNLKLKNRESVKNMKL
jgi:hypothetical protein